MDEKREEKSPLAVALGRSKDSHVFGWCDVSKFDLEKCSKDAPFLKKLDGTKTAILTVHYDNELKLNVSLFFPNEESAKDGAKEMMGGVRLARAQIGMMAATMETAEGSGRVSGRELKLFKDLAGFMEKLEKAMQTVEAKPTPCDDGTWVVSLGCDVKTSRNVITKAMCAIPDAETNMLGLKPPRYPDIGKAGAVPPDPEASSAAAAQLAAGAPAALLPQVVQASASVPVPPKLTIAPPVPLDVVQRTYVPLPLPIEPTIKLTVANTAKAKAQLYQQGTDNKLVFCKEIPFGETIDVTAKAGQRWVVIYPEKKDGGETFVLGNADGIWVLR
jgi:hypothetical protein